MGDLMRNWRIELPKIAIGIGGLTILFAISQHNFLLFHGLAELFSIAVAWSVFLMVWNTRQIVRNDALIFLGIAYFFIGLLDLAHTLSYQGTGVFPDTLSANYATQLWIAARAVEALSLFLYPFMLNRRIYIWPVIAGYAGGSGMLLAAIFLWGIFPDCFIPGQGLTAFKVGAEYAISAALAAAIALLWRRREQLENDVFVLMVWAMGLTIAAELSFTLYADVYGLSNVAGHFLKILSFFLIYRALVRATLIRPYTALFRELERERQALRESEARFRSAIRAGGAVAYHRDRVNNAYLFVDDGIEALTGYPPEQFTPRVWKSLMISEIPLGKQSGLSVDEAVKKATEKPGSLWRSEVYIRTANGDHRWILDASVNVGDQAGNVTESLGILQDITEHKLAVLERENMQAQLQQAQKLESVGQLAGGVAHDFNNMLSVILGHAEMALASLPPEQPLYEDLQEIQKAAHRSAQLTRQLLAFARKQIIAPRVMDLNETVESILKMLRRLVGENIDLSWQPDSGLWQVKMDAAQVDQILANLSVNARDAGAHRVVLKTENAALDAAFCATRAGFVPGDYALLRVQDDGCGMDRETLKNIFEPFFTTKPVGAGTGLGLATVYGIVRQNNGRIEVSSTSGEGTTFHIYLPRHMADGTLAEVEKQADIPVGRGETLLLVEDEAPLLNMTQKILSRMGYQVLGAASAEAALEVAKTHAGKIDVLITDVIMPGMSGPELAQALMENDPGLTCLFVSGYTANEIDQYGILEEGVHFLQKPIPMATLAAKVREVLKEG